MADVLRLHGRQGAAGAQHHKRRFFPQQPFEVSGRQGRQRFVFAPRVSGKTFAAKASSPTTAARKAK